MNQRTYEIISKWVAKESGVKVVFEEDCNPHASLKDKTIYLPTNIEVNDPWAAMSTLVHEAAHIRHSVVLPKNLSRNAIRHNLLNAIEDIRIDSKNFRLLPNVHEWYRRSAREQQEERKKMDMTKVSLEKKVLINSIYGLEGLWEGIIQDPAAIQFNQQHGVDNIVSNAVQQIDSGDWKGVNASVTQLMKIFKLEDPDPADEISMEFIVGQPAKMKEGAGEDMDISGFIAGIGKAFVQGPGDGTCSGGEYMTEGVIEDLTKHKFKELLNIKERRIVFEGNQLNHDNLTQFFMGGDIEELFVEDDIIKKKKSKMMFLIDASGSMGAPLLCGTPRKAVVLGTIKHLVDTLRDVMAEDSLDVDYQIAGFTGDYHPFSKENWEKEYQKVSGGTDLGGAFTKAMEDMMSDTTIDGSRIMILFTDGDVYEDDVKLIKESINKSGADVKFLLVGVGSDINCDFVLNLIGDNNILMKECADMVLMDAIASVI